MSRVTDSANDAKGVQGLFLYILFFISIFIFVVACGRQRQRSQGRFKVSFFFCRVWQSAVADSGNDANRIAMRLFARVSVCFYYSISLLYYSTRLVLLQFYWC